MCLRVATKLWLTYTLRTLPDGPPIASPLAIVHLPQSTLSINHSLLGRRFPDVEYMYIYISVGSSPGDDVIIWESTSEDGYLYIYTYRHHPGVYVLSTHTASRRWYAMTHLEKRVLLFVSVGIPILRHANKYA